MKTILLPSDLSANSSAALRYGLQLSAQLGYRVIVFHCSKIPADVLMKAKTALARESITRNELVEKTHMLQQQLKKACNATGIAQENVKVMVESNPFVVENILEVAEKLKVDLIVMGTHGASGIKKHILGSNTSELISKSDIPVLSVPGLFRFRPVSKIVFATDLHNLKKELSQVLPFAKATAADLKVVYLDYGPGTTGKGIVDAELLLKKSMYKIRSWW